MEMQVIPKYSVNIELKETKSSTRRTQRSTQRCPQSKERFKSKVLLLCLVVAVIASITIGASLNHHFGNSFPLSQCDIDFIQFPGTLFMRAIKCMVVPLIIATVVNSMAGLDKIQMKRLSIYFAVFILATTLLGVATAQVLVIFIKPGNNGHLTNSSSPIQVRCTTEQYTQRRTHIVVMDIARRIIPDNIITTMFITETTCDVQRCQMVPDLKGSNGTIESCSSSTKVEKDWTVNVLGLITISMIIGIVLRMVKPKGSTLRNGFRDLELVVMTAITKLIWLSPIAVFFLILAKMLQGDKDPMMELRNLAWYTITVLIALVIHACITQSILLTILTKGQRKAHTFAWRLAQPLLTALGTASSTVTLPSAIRALVHTLNSEDDTITQKDRDKNVAVVNFIVPIGCTMNMNGTAIFETVAAIYIAQCNNVHLTLSQFFTVGFTTTLMSIGTAGVPQAGVITLVAVILSIGLSANDIVMILAVDWFIDRVRTAVNVWGDCVAVGIISNWVYVSDDQVNDEELDHGTISYNSCSCADGN